MKHKVNERVRELVLESEFKGPYPFATKVLGYTKSKAESFRGYMNDERPMPEKIIQDVIRNFPKINPNWILTGKPPKFLEEYESWEDSFDIEKLYTIKDDLENGIKVDEKELAACYLALFRKYLNAKKILSGVEKDL